MLMLLKFLIILMILINICKITTQKFLSGNFTYCYGKTIKMPLLDTRRDCAEILAPKPKNSIIENSDEPTDFMVIEELKPIATASFCYRVQTTTYTTWHPFNFWSYESKLKSEKLPVTNEQCDDIKKGYCDIGTDKISKKMVKLDCYQNHCRTKLKPKDGYRLFWNYNKQVVNCYLEVLNINDKNENMNEGREKSECVSPAICNESACTCFTSNSIIDWNVGFYEKQIKHYVAVQYMRDLNIRDNALFDSHNMFLVEIVQEMSATVFRETNEDLKLEYPWIASQELGK